MCTAIPRPTIANLAADASTKPLVSHDETDPDRRAASHTAGETCLNVAARHFRALTDGDKPLSVDGRAIASDLPQRMINLRELRTILLRQSTSFAVRDLAWRHLVSLARSGGEDWVTAAVGVAIPALRRMAAQLSAGYPDAKQDLDAELLSAFLNSLRQVNIDEPRVITRLCSPAFVAARRYRDAELAARRRPQTYLPTAGAAVPDGDEHDVLNEAVCIGLISRADADLIGVTRLGGQSLADYAARIGIPYQTVNVRRNRAEKKLYAAIKSGVLRLPTDDDAEVIRDATTTVMAGW